MYRYRCRHSQFHWSHDLPLLAGNVRGYYRSLLRSYHANVVASQVSRIVLACLSQHAHADHIYCPIENRAIG